MKQFAVNRHVLRVSRLYLLLWMMAGSGLIILIAMESPYWFFPVPGFVFLFLWLMLAGLYPKTVVVGEDGMAVLLMGSEKVKIINFADLLVRDQVGYFEINNCKVSTGRKYLIAKKNLAPELEKLLQQLLLAGEENPEQKKIF